jgi:hypothetical protein
MGTTSKGLFDSSLNSSMKISDLFEAQDYDKIKDPALRWLA